MISHRNLFFLFPAEMSEMAEIYQWDLWEVIIFTTEETEMVASLTQNMSFYLPLNMVFLFPAETADITERAAPAMRHDHQ